MAIAGIAAAMHGGQTKAASQKKKTNKGQHVAHVDLQNIFGSLMQAQAWSTTGLKSKEFLRQGMAACQEVKKHEKMDGDAEFDAWFQQGTEESKLDPPTSGQVVHPAEVSHLITKKDLELFRRAVCRKLEGFYHYIDKDEEDQGGKSSKDLKYVKEQADANHDALLCKAHEKLYPMRDEQQREKVQNMHDVSGACCCSTVLSAGTVDCSWVPRYKIPFLHSRETNLCHLQPSNAGAESFHTTSLDMPGKDDEASIQDSLSLVDKCWKDDADWKEYKTGIQSGSDEEEEEEKKEEPSDNTDEGDEEDDQKSAKSEKECKDPKTAALIKKMNKEEQDFLAQLTKEEQEQGKSVI